MEPDADMEPPDAGMEPPDAGMEPDAGPADAGSKPDAGKADAGVGGNYVLNLSGFNAFAGDMVHLKVKSSTGATTYGQAQGRVNAAGNVRLTVNAVLFTGVSYRADFYVDVNNDNAYSFTQDHSWRRAVTGPASNGNLNDNFTFNTTYTDITPF